MKTILFFLSIYGFAVGSPISSKVFRPDYSYDSNVEAWYKYHEIPATWRDADMRCYLEGGVLASPVNQLQKQAMMDILKQKSKELSSGSTGRDVFTGIHATYSDGSYATVEGTPLSDIEHKWAPNEPDNYENKEQCLAMSRDGTLADVDCNQTLPYLCFKQNDPNMSLTLCGTVDKEYHFKPETGHCYKIHKTPASWSQAHLTCQAERATLAIINSMAESMILSQIFENTNSTFKDIKKSGVPFLSPNFAHVGFRVFDDTLIWRTLTGHTLEAAGFASFPSGEPNNPGVENCGSIRRNGKLNDIRCEELAPFFCEMIVSPPVE